MPESLETKIDKLLIRFKDEVKAGNTPRIEEYLNSIPKSARDELRQQLVAIESNHRADNEMATILPVMHPTSQSVDVETPTSPADLNATIPPTRNTSGIVADESADKSIRIDQYQLIKKIGEGGMGSVWLAEQQEPVVRKVALKLIRADAGSKDAIARFEAERQALAMMDSDNIAKVLDGGTTTDGSPYFVMELVDGIPLNEYTDQKKLGIRERIRLMVDVSTAIQHAHQKGIIHRDLKPSNVLVAEVNGKPVPKVIDFGLAKALEHTNRLTDKTMQTEFGQVLGTLQYMSPEQASIDSIDIDTRTDVYSLGVLLYELLTGSTPLEAETLKKSALLQILANIREKDPPRPSTRLSSSGYSASDISAMRQISSSKFRQILRGDLDWIVMKSLEKDRARRYSTASAFAEDLSRFLNHEPVEARPPSASYRVKKFVRKNRGLVGSLTAMTALLIAGIAGTTWFALQSRSETARALKAENTAKIETEKAQENAHQTLLANERTEATLSDAKYVVANVRQKEGRVSEAISLLASIPEEHRNIEWYLARGEFGGSDLTLFGHEGPVNAVDWSLNGRWIASGSDDHSIRIWNSTTGTETRRLDGHDSPIQGLRFSPNCNLLASASNDGKIIVWSTETWTEFCRFAQPAAITSIAFHQDNERLLVTCKGSKQTGFVWNLNHPQKAVPIVEDQDKTPKDAKHGNFVAFSPDGRGFLSDYQRIVEISDVNRSDERLGVSRILITDTAISGGIPFDINPNGKQFAHVEVIGGYGSRSRIRLVDFASKETETLEEFHVQSALTISKLAYSPAGDHICSAEGNSLRIWNIPNSTDFSLRGHHKSVNDMTFSPDGSRLVSASDDGTLKVWDAKTGKKNLAIRHPDPVTQVKYTDDGMHIIVQCEKQSYLRSFASNFEQARNWPSRFIYEFCFEQAGVNCLATSCASSSPVSNLQTVAWLLTAGRSGIGKIVLSPDGTRAILLNGNSKNASSLLTLISNKTSTRLQIVDSKTLESHPETQIQHARFSADSSTFAILLDEKPGFGSAKKGYFAINIYQANNGRLIKKIESAESIHDFAFNFDASRLAISTERELNVLRTSDWNPVSAEKSLKVNDSFGFLLKDLEFHPSAPRIAVAREQEVVLWDWESGNEVASMKTRSTVVDLAWHPTGNSLAAGCEDGNVLIWNATKNDSVNRLEGFTGDIEQDFFRAYQHYKARTSPTWHADRADEAESNKDWYAAVFYRAKLLESDREQALAWDLLHDAYDRFKNEVNEQSLPADLKQTLSLPRGKTLPKITASQRVQSEISLLRNMLLVSSEIGSPGGPNVRPRFDSSLLRVLPFDSNRERKTLLALLKLATGESEKAIDIAKEVLEHRGEYPAAHGVLALAYRKLGRDAESSKALENMRELISAGTNVDSKSEKLLQILDGKNDKRDRPKASSRTFGLRQTIWPIRTPEGSNIISRGGGGVF